MGMPIYKHPAIICDLDGTLCLFNGRGPFEMEKCDTDLINLPVSLTLRAFHKAGTQIIFVTGRFEEHREKTCDWLRRYGPPYRALYMRADGDYRKDAEVKTEIYRQHIEPHYDVLLSLDDRNQSVECWRSLGVPCFQVAPGDF